VAHWVDQDGTQSKGQYLDKLNNWPELLDIASRRFAMKPQECMSMPAYLQLNDARSLTTLGFGALERDLQILHRVVGHTKRKHREHILLNMENAAFMVSWYCNVSSLRCLWGMPDNCVLVFHSESTGI